MNMHKHEHAGCTRKSLENPGQVLLSAGLPEGGVLLDIGTGSGYLAIAAAGIMGTMAQVYALDAHEASIGTLKAELTEKNIHTITALTADVVKGIPLPRNTADVCLMSNVIHGFAANGELDAVMKNIGGVLKEDGTMVVIDFKKAETGFGPPMAIRLAPDEVESALSPFGYKRLRQFEAGPGQYCIVLQRVSLQDKHC